MVNKCKIFWSIKFISLTGSFLGVLKVGSGGFGGIVKESAPNVVKKGRFSLVKSLKDMYA